MELQTRYIGEILAEAGWHVVYLAPSLEGKADREKVRDGIELWHYPAFSYGFQAPVKRLNGMMEEIAPDVIYQRGWGQLQESRFALRYAKSNGIPLAFALSSDRDLESLPTTRRVMGLREKAIVKRLGLMPNSLYSDAALRITLRTADVLIVQHEGQQDVLKKGFGRESHILRTIHPEVRGEIRKPERKKVVWINNYRPLKRGDLFVELACACHDLDCDFVLIYGRTKKEYIEPVLAKAGDLDNLIVHGEISPEEAESLLEEAILFVNTSEYEGFPNTFVQAWLRETPTVSLNVDPGGVIVREQIGKHSDNVPQMIADVRELVTKDAVRDAMGKRARRYAEEMHGRASVHDQVICFFEDVVNKGNRA